MRNLSDECKTCQDNKWDMIMCIECCGIPHDILERYEEIRNKKENKDEPRTL